MKYTKYDMINNFNNTLDLLYILLCIDNYCDLPLHAGRAVPALAQEIVLVVSLSVHVSTAPSLQVLV